MGFNVINRRNFKRCRRFLESQQELIKRLFNNNQFGFMTLKNQLVELSIHNPAFKLISSKTYREYLINSEIAQYKSFEKISATSNSDKNKLIRQVVLRLMLESILANKSLLFFDESSIQSSSFRKKAWGLKNKRLFRQSREGYPYIKILAVISLTGLESFQIFKRVNGQTIASFLEKTISIYSAAKSNSEIVLLLDNAKANHTKNVHLLAKQFNLMLLYNAIASPHLNTIEYLFEFLKRPLRNQLSVSKQKIIELLIQQARIFDHEQVKRIWMKQQNDFWRVINGKDLFLSKANPEEVELDFEL